ncbi:MAG: hypothetical protein AAGJ95_09435 [Cyanobacteria bacterium J06554_11]
MTQKERDAKRGAEERAVRSARAVEFNRKKRRKQVVKVWITKYALTKGIQEAEAETWANHKGMVSVPKWGALATFHGEGREWHRTRESALKRAEEMRLRRIASLEKQLDKLRALRFE